MQLAALEGCVIGVDLPEMRSKRGLLPVEGVERAGESALRNSVYACGGVMGIFMSSSSCLITSRRSGKGLLGNWEGKVAEFGVWRAGRAGLGDFGVAVEGDVVLMVGGTGFFSVSSAIGMAGEAGFSISIAVGILAVELERP